MDLIPIHPLAIAPLLLTKLQQIVNSNGFTAFHSEVSAPPAIAMIPLYRAKDTQRIIYICAVALKLAKTLQRSSMEIATAIARHLCDSSASESRFDADGLAFTVTVIPPGKIYLQLTDRGIATWLQRAIATELGEERIQNWGLKTRDWECDRASSLKPQSCTPSSTDLFPIQYAHARCCALLRLAQQEGLIFRVSNPAIAHCQDPKSLPWLDPLGQLRLVHPTERTLISQLVSVIDALGSGAERSQNLSGLAFATALSHDFMTFYSTNQILGSVKSENPPLVQGRLGLIALSQKVLKYLLEEALGEFAPEEL